MLADQIKKKKIRNSYWPIFLLQTAITEIPGKTLNEKLQNALVKLQVVMNCIVDGDSDKLAVDKITGVKQVGLCGSDSILWFCGTGLCFSKELTTNS